LSNTSKKSSERSEESTFRHYEKMTLPELMDAATERLPDLKVFRSLGVTKGRYGLTVRAQWASPQGDRHVASFSGPPELADDLYAYALRAAIRANLVTSKRSA